MDRDISTAIQLVFHGQWGCHCKQHQPLCYLCWHSLHHRQMKTSSLAVETSWSMFLLWDKWLTQLTQHNYVQLDVLSLFSELHPWKQPGPVCRRNTHCYCAQYPFPAKNKILFVMARRELLKHDPCFPTFTSSLLKLLSSFEQWTTIHGWICEIRLKTMKWNQRNEKWKKNFVFQNK